MEISKKVKDKFAKFSIIFSVLVLITIASVTYMGAGDYQKYVIYDDAATTTNDTLISSWIPLYGATNVALHYYTDDTSYVKGSFDYRYGADTEIGSVAADTLSLDTRSSAVSGLSKGKILQGYGLATSLIPGANQVRVTLIWKAGSETTTKIHCALIYGD